MSPTKLNPETRRAIAADVAARGLAPVARALGVPASSLSSVLAGSARQGTQALVAIRWAALREAKAAP